MENRRNFERRAIVGRDTQTTQATQFNPGHLGGKKRGSSIPKHPRFAGYAGYARFSKLFIMRNLPATQLRQHCKGPSFLDDEERGRRPLPRALTTRPKPRLFAPFKLAQLRGWTCKPFIALSLSRHSGPPFYFDFTGEGVQTPSRPPAGGRHIKGLAPQPGVFGGSWHDGTY